MNDVSLARMDFKCDYPRCFLLPFAEVYPPIGENPENWGWCYLCLPHFITEYLIKKNPRIGGWCIAEWLGRLPLVSWLWEFHCKHSWFNKNHEEKNDA